MNVEVWLSLEDSPNSAGIIIDAVRATKGALDHGCSGSIIEDNAYLVESAGHQFGDPKPQEMLKRLAKPSVGIAEAIDELCVTSGKPISVSGYSPAMNISSSQVEAENLS